MAENRIDIIIRTIKQGLGDKETKKTLKEMGKGFQELTGVSLGWTSAAAFAVGAIVKVVAGMKAAEAAAAASAQANAKLNAVLASTQGAAGMKAGQLNAMAAELSRTAGLDDELVASAEAVLLTFTKISSTTFPDAMQAAVDMSAVLGIDLQGSVTMLGKAMNDFSGYTALARAGVSFTAEQKAQIEHFKETNDLVGYQNLLLKEMQTEYGGAAKAINDAGDGSANLKISADNLSEAMGRSFMPIARAWNEFWTEYNNQVADAINANYDYDESVKSLGITTEWVYDEAGNAIQGYFKDGHQISIDEVQDRVHQKRANEAWGASLTAQAKALGLVGDESVQTEEEIQKLNEEMLKSAAAVTDWQTKYTSAKDASSQFDLSLDMIHTGLQEMGAAGEEAYMGLLLGMGEITPAAVRAYAETQVVIGKIKEMLNQGYSIDIVVRYVQNWQGGGGTGGVVDNSDIGNGVGGLMFGNEPKSQGNVGQSYTDANGITWVQDLNPDGSEKGWHHLSSGGPVFAGQVAIVGEKGPEKVIFGQDGYVFPTGSGGGNNINIYVNGAGDPRNVANEVMRRLDLQMGRR